MSGTVLRAGEEVVMTGDDVGSEALDRMQEDDGELSDSSLMSDISISQTGDENKQYSVDNINDFLHLTKGRTVNVLCTFPDGNKFIMSAKY